MNRIRFRISKSELNRLDRKSKEFEIKTTALIKSIALRSQIVYYPVVTTKTPKVNKRNQEIVIYFFDEELTVIKNKAERLGIGPEEFVMIAALNCSFIKPELNGDLE